MPLPKGFKHSPETREKIRSKLRSMSEAISERVSSSFKSDPKFRAQVLRNAFKKGNRINRGRKKSEDFKKRMSARMSAHWKNPEFKARMSVRKYKIGPSHYNWTGGRSKNGEGYILIHMPAHPFCDPSERIYEHRLVVEKELGRFLKKTEHVHHLNEIKYDNRSENLICLSSNSAHRRFHKDPSKVRPEEIIFDGRIIPPSTLQPIVQRGTHQ